MRGAEANASIDTLLNAVCAVAAEKGIDLRDIQHALSGRYLAGRAPNRDSLTLLALLENGWEDLTGICDISDDGNTERRLLRDPVGDFHIASEHSERETDTWNITTETITPARARHFYVAHCIPESLAGGFVENESPALRLDTSLHEMEALMQAVATYAADEGIHGKAEKTRMRVGLTHLIDHTCSRARDAHEAL